MLLAIGVSSFARQMRNPCGTRKKDKYMTFDDCMGRVLNPMTDWNASGYFTRRTLYFAGPQRQWA